MAAKIVNQAERVSEKKCRNSDYGNTFLNSLSKMRVNQKFFDFSLDIDGELIYVHKLALAIASDYFAAMFEADMKERNEGTARLQDVDTVAVKALVDYVYSGIITLTEANVEAVLSASDLFQFVWVKEECIQFLESSLSRNNCFRVRKFADMHSCKGLKEVSHKYILDHFHDLIAEEDLLLLSFEEIKELIKDVQHIVKLEDIAYKTAINWVKHDLERRRVYLAEFMSQIRLPLVSTEFLTDHIVTESLLRDDQKCNKFVMEALTYQLKESKHQLTKVTQLHEKCQTESKHQKESFYIFLIGGFEELMPAGRCKIYDISKRTTFCFSDMNEIRSDNSAVSFNGLIYSMGGFDLKTAECYDPVTKRWSYIAPMNNSRRSFGICTYNDLIYVVSGKDTSTVESYDSTVNKWNLCQNIPVRCTRYSRATVAENSIYSLTQATNGNDTLDRFDPRDGKWCNLNEMVAKSAEYELLSYDRTLFAIGNEDCKRFDIRVNRWQTMRHMLSERRGFSAVIVAKDIYVLGGDVAHFKFYLTSVDRFNICHDEWKRAASIGHHYYGGGAAVLSGHFEYSKFN